MEEITEAFQNIRLAGKTDTLNKVGLGWRAAAGSRRTVPAADIEQAEWIQTLVSNCQLKLKTKGNTAITFDGFNPSDKERIKAVFTDKYRVAITECQLATRGWNFGDIEVQGPLLCFNVDGRLSFEIPLADVSQAQAPTKNDVILEFHQPDAADDMVSLMEMRLHLPSDPDIDPKDTPAANRTRSGMRPRNALNIRAASATDSAQVLKKAEIVTAGRGILRLKELLMTTPRGRYDVEMFGSFLRMHGKSYDYKILYESITMLTHLRKPDERHACFVVSLDPPIRQGHAVYPHVLFQFPIGDEIVVDDINIPSNASEKFPDLKETYSGSTDEVVRDIFCAMTRKKVTRHGNFKSTFGQKAVRCSLKANDGYLFPMEKCFFFVHKPPTYIPYDQVSSVEFARVGSGSLTRTFDLIVLLKTDTTHVFTSVQMDEHVTLRKFLQRKVDIKEPGGDVVSRAGMLESDSDEEEEADSDEDGGEYRARTSTASARASSRPSRKSKPAVLIDELDGGGDSEESDEDFMAVEDDDAIPEEYDEDAVGNEEEGGDEQDDDDDDDDDDEGDVEAGVKRARSSSGEKRKTKRQKVDESDQGAAGVDNDDDDDDDEYDSSGELDRSSFL